MKLYSAELENPDKLPLNELYFTIKKDGVQQKIPALSEKWLEKRTFFTKYSPLPLKNGKLINQSAVLDEWLNETEWFNRDLEWMLQLEHYRFWSNMIYEPGCLESVISFLQEALPFYIPIAVATDSDKIITLYAKVLKNILTVLCRLVTNKESDKEWITRQHLAELLYNKFLISIPMVFDMLVAYGRENQLVIGKFLETLFKIEPKYMNDLKLALQFVQQTFEQLEKQSNEAGSAILEDLSLYLLDIAVTLGMLVELCPNVRSICIEIKMGTSISSVYENVIPPLYKNIYAKDSTDRSLQYLNFARIELLQAYQAILNLHIENILATPKKAREISEKYVGILIESAGDHSFVVDYQKLYPIENDLDILQQAYPKLDPIKIEFVLKAYVEDAHVQAPTHRNGVTHQKSGQENVIDLDLEDMEGACAFDPTEIDPMETIRAVLPDLGGGFIKKLLQRYDDPEQAIAAVLEGNLPPDLIEADFEEPEIPVDKYDVFFTNTGIDRLNIYDGDAYDVMTQDQPKGIIKRGKGFPGANSQTNVLNDKSHVKAVRSKYVEYSIVCDEVDENNEYDDEYDDSYDALAESERKTTKALLANEIDEESEDEYESGDEQDKSKYRNDGIPKQGKDFCENPEATRARYEQSRQERFGARTGSNKDWKNRDVVGKPKGQGQSTEVLQNRVKKTLNKSTRANHNRKTGATFKRSRGMVPS